MIKVTVTENDAVLDKVEFDDANVIRHEGGVAVVSRDIMKHCTQPGLWHGVAHASAWIAETGSLLEGWRQGNKKRLRPENRPASILLVSACPMLAAVIEQPPADIPPHRIGAVRLDRVEALDLDNAEAAEALDAE
jgi:hypothetical protein